MSKPTIDLTGKRFGRLVVIEKAKVLKIKKYVGYVSAIVEISVQ